MNLNIFFLTSFLNLILGFQSFEKKSSKIPQLIGEIISDEVENNQDLRDIAVIIADNNFSQDFHQKLIKSLPREIPKVIINFDLFYVTQNILSLEKSTFIIFISDHVENVSRFLTKHYFFVFIYSKMWFYQG